MENQKGLTLIEVIVICCMVLFLAAILIPAFDNGSRIAPRVVCGTNLKGLGTAIMVYANDYDDRYPQLPGEGPWAKRLGFDHDLPHPDFGQGGAQSQTPRTITASWYLLVREADVGPKSFICPLSKQGPFDGKNNANLEITQLWDFGPDPYRHVSYALHNPYGQFPGHGDRSATFAMAADMSPWFRNGEIVAPGLDGAAPQIINAADETTWKLGNSLNNPQIRRRFFGWWRTEVPLQGQNVLYADGHSSFEKTPNCGIKRDNIYTYWSKENEPTDQDIQGGQNPTARDKENDAKSKDDSFLAI
ncbi:MAG: hypothetical protein IH624_02990 [Phycisphaerae bacterium]|nr:hypothetical protein [Phycisphaerae bacterium]